MEYFCTQGGTEFFFAMSKISVARQGVEITVGDCNYYYLKNMKTQSRR